MPDMLFDNPNPVLSFWNMFIGTGEVDVGTSLHGMD